MHEYSNPCWFSKRNAHTNVHVLSHSIHYILPILIARTHHAPQGSQTKHHHIQGLGHVIVLNQGIGGEVASFYILSAFVDVFSKSPQDLRCQCPQAVGCDNYM